MKKTKLFLSIILSLIYATSSLGNNPSWKFLMRMDHKSLSSDDKSHSNVYYDENNIRRDADYQRDTKYYVWILFDNDENSVSIGKSLKQLRNVDCGRGMIAIIKDIYYEQQMGGGHQEYNSDLTGDWRIIEPGSLEDKIYDKVCRYQ